MRETFKRIYQSGKAGLLSLQKGDMRKEEEETFERYSIDNSIEYMRAMYFSNKTIEKEARENAFKILNECCLNEDEKDKFTEDELIDKFTDEWGIAMDSYINGVKSIKEKMFNEKTTSHNQ